MEGRRRENGHKRGVGNGGKGMRRCIDKSILTFAKLTCQAGASCFVLLVARPCQGKSVAARKLSLKAAISLF